MNAGNDLQIHNYHAHIYFSGEDETRRARALCDRIKSAFADRFAVGRFHGRPVGPHPRGSCQITIQPGDLETALPWLASNRDGLTLFCHLNTGNDLPDHTDHVIWLGESESLRLELFAEK